MTTVFFDIDTQLDFLYPAGALYVPGAEQILDRVSALNRYAALHGSFVISSMDAHTEDDPEFKTWPHHCVAGVLGQHKPASTLLAKRLNLRNAAMAGDLALAGIEQILLEKQSVDCFTNRHLERLLDRLKADRYVVYGVVTEICVRRATQGLLKTGRRVELVIDAIRSLDRKAGDAMIAEFTAGGGVLTSCEAVLGR